MQIEFHGANKNVTGSCHLVKCNTIQLLVDCGMFQGGRDADRKNRVAHKKKDEDIFGPTQQKHTSAKDQKRDGGYQMENHHRPPLEHHSFGHIA